MPVPLEIKILPMTMDHLSGVMEVERQSFPYPWSQDAFMFELLHNKVACYLVAMAEETVVGYAGMWVLVDEAHVTNIGVLPQWRRQGIARALLSRLMEIAKANDADKMTLEVRKSNWGARKLYENLGFKALGCRRNYYAETHEDAVIMWKFDL
ncbi:MAG: ribosomal protein S18-alanine N-acetyltransferase [bacterium]|jgi:ribosomal-protein-alanine N-acetyltransferase